MMPNIDIVIIPLINNIDDKINKISPIVLKILTLNFKQMISMAAKNSK